MRQQQDCSLILYLVFLFQNSVFSVEVLDTVFMPHERHTIDDCHLRFTQYNGFEYMRYAPGYGGILAQPFDFPHMAAIGWKSSSGVIEWDCGGSLITEKFVLTAAHCSRNIDDMEPNIVRLGDIFPTEIPVPSFLKAETLPMAQQFNIKNIVRHPKHTFAARYFDIAVIELDQNVVLTRAVCPACLWNSDEIYFPRFETAGFGATGFAEPKSGKLIKLSLSPLSLEECSQVFHNKTRGLERGLDSSHICAFDPKMDTCPGDSGGPLQIKLQAIDYLIPFIVGITSFGKACSSGGPGVYTKIFPFIGWIESVVNKSLNPKDCLQNYGQYQDIKIFSWPYARIYNIVKLYWNESFTSDCTGSLIDYNYVLVSARCTSDGKKEPTHVEINQNRVEIVRIIRHPTYNRRFLYHDIALLQLKDYTNFDTISVPLCLRRNGSLPSHEIFIPALILGRVGETLELDSTVKFTRNLMDQPLCPKDNSFLLSNKPHGLIDEQIEVCPLNPVYFVPKLCKLERIEYRLQNHEFMYTYLHAILSEGGDCGQGRPSIMTRIAPYFDWIESVILNRTLKAPDSFIFRDDDLYEGDPCLGREGVDGICVRASNCGNVSWHKADKLCNFEEQPVVCCNLNSIKGAAKIVDRCSDNHQPFEKVKIVNSKKEYAQFKHTAQLIWPRENWLCLGALISTKHVLTSAECGRHNPELIRIGSFHTVYGDFEFNDTSDSLQSFSKFKIDVHPDLENHNVALITLVESVSINEFVVPACLWKNSTHIPLKMYSMTLLNNTAKIYQNHKIAFPSDACGNFINQSLKSNEMCVDNLFRQKRMCEVAGAPLQAVLQQNGRRVSYIIGILNFSYCNQASYSVYTKVSSYVNWIRAAMGEL